MADSPTPITAAPGANPPPIVIQQFPPQPFWMRRWFVRLLMIALVLSLMYCLSLHSEYEAYFQASTPPTERFHSGDKTAEDKIAIISVSGTIMPPFTKQILDSIKRAKEDDDVKGVLLSIDSPGGLVADSDQIYRKLTDLRTKSKKPIFVSMKRIAASGGVYVAMGAGEDGKIFAEPTTWTGSIGVIIPRYDASRLAEKAGVATDALKTGEFKDSLDPLRAMTDREREVWREILDDSFQRFIKIIDDNRATLNAEQVTALATGQVFTAESAVKNGLIDQIGDEDDALDALKTKLGLTQVRVIEYRFPSSLLDLLVGSAKLHDPEMQLRKLFDVSVPRAMYFFGSPSTQLLPIVFSTWSVQ